ncbi:ATP-binding protein [Embleya sp. NPDC008237]|uniref:ATP-binding protein n=1 Tax=Embleya sp. NPDC008237 TaxID=3363978 RepID=UPI0036E91C61
MSTDPQDQLRSTHHVFTQRLSATPRGARLARRFATQQLEAWGIAYGSELSDSVTLIVAELAANAVMHAGMDGRGSFVLLLTLRQLPGEVAATLCVEITDSGPSPTPRDTPTFGPAFSPPDLTTPTPPPDEAEDGRGLAIVSALADRMTIPASGPDGSTVRAELDIPFPPLARRDGTAEVRVGSTYDFEAAPSGRSKVTGRPPHCAGAVQQVGLQRLASRDMDPAPKAPRRPAGVAA